MVIDSLGSSREAIQNAPLVATLLDLPREPRNAKGATVEADQMPTKCRERPTLKP